MDQGRLARKGFSAPAGGLPARVILKDTTLREGEEVERMIRKEIASKKKGSL